MKGHDGKVTAINWSKDDQRLVSCADDGSVYEWDVSTGRRVNETVVKTCAYNDVAISPGTNQVTTHKPKIFKLLLVWTPKPIAS